MKFERVSGYPEAQLPERSTKGSAGYDFFVSDGTMIPAHSIGLVPTGIKAQIDEGYYLQLAVRSSTPIKKGLILANGIGIIDSDYYNNPSNEGIIMFQLYNITDKDIFVPKGDKIGQGMFLKYAVTDDDMVESIRTGGFGSTDEPAKILQDSL